ncbi:MAG: hypothetical protein PVJ53_15960 [Desulfobacterales bacterium]|jgi:hypothetical protein
MPLPGVDDVLYITSHEGDHADTPCGQQRLQGARNRTTDQVVRTQFRQLLGFLQRLVAGQQDRSWGDPSRRIGFDQEHAPGYVKDRCDAVVPNGECGFHFPGSF